MMIVGNEDFRKNFVNKLKPIWVWEGSNVVDLEKSYNNDRKALRQGHYCTNNITKQMR